MKGRFRIAVILAGVLAVSSMPLWGKRPALAMLNGLAKGRWELRWRNDGGKVQSICLHDGRQLIQLHHRSAKCTRLVLEDTPTQVTVQYTCPGRGYGRTHIRRETSQLVQIDTQGIANGAPFAFAVEARRVGECKN